MNVVDIEHGETSDVKTFIGNNMRIGFVRKVYGILSMQLLFTTFMCILSINTSFGMWQNSHIAFVIIAAIVNITTMIFVMCSQTAARKVPLNYILLALFTFSEAYIVSGSIAFVDKMIVLMAALLTTGMTIGLTLYAMTTKRDFTMCGNVFFTLTWSLILFIIFSFIFPNNLFELIICCLSLVFYSFYLIYDTQLIMNGGHYGLSIDDYILGAIMIYIDVIILFIRMVELLGVLKRD